jgi:hypothetical protein
LGRIFFDRNADERPLLAEGTGISMNCPYCGTPKFRTSRIRFSDLPRLALLQFPVRCRLCRERFHVGFSLALHLLQSQRVREDEEATVRREKYKTERENHA